MLIRVCCLYRVSTTAQADHNDIPMQREACHEYAREHGLWIIKEYQERGISAFKTPAEDRDALQKLREDALEKRFDILFVFMFDRIGRRSDETPFVVEWFIKHGIRVISVKEGEQILNSHTDQLRTLEQAAQAARRRVRTGGVVAGALLARLGAAALFAPLLLGWSLALLLVIGFTLYGAAQLWAWAETPRDRRSAWTLLGGLALLGFGGFALWAAFFTPSGGAALIAALANGVAFFTVVQGISQIITFAEMRRLGTSGAGWVLAAGILNTVAGILIVLQPLVGWLALSTFWGIYLMFSGLALAVESLSDHRGCCADT